MKLLKLSIFMLAMVGLTGLTQSHAQTAVVSCPGEEVQTVTVPQFIVCWDPSPQAWVDYASMFVPQNSWTCIEPCPYPWQKCVRTLAFDCSTAPEPTYFAGCLVYPQKDIRVKITCYCGSVDPEEF